MLPEGPIKVDVMGMANPSEAYTAITRKMFKAISENQEWFIAYQKEHYVEGQGLPYDEKMGITKNEYDTLKILSGELKLTKAGEGEFLVEKFNNLITIKAAGPLSVMEGIRINPDSNTVYMDGIRLQYEGVSDIKDSANVIGLWKGHVWKFEDVNKNYNSLEDLNGKMYSFTLGQAKKANRMFIIVKKQVVANGTSVENVEIPMMLN